MNTRPKTPKTNPFDLPPYYLDDSSSEALKRLRIGKYYDFSPESYTAKNDALLILTHWHEDITKPVFNLKFYVEAFTFIFVKAYGRENGTLTRPLDDSFIKLIVDAIEAHPVPSFCPLLNDMHVLRSEFRDLFNRVIGLEVRLRINKRGHDFVFRNSRITLDQFTAALYANDGNIQKTADDLGISDHAIYNHSIYFDDIRALIDSAQSGSSHE